ncbi:hypothetical protein BS78_09G049700 [Paspalum vaginatum]|nr:hypothetical protein BS78_09G049700 [Paspalum vaginatum]
MGIRPGITKMISNASCPVNLLDQLSSGCHGKGPLFHLRALAQTCSNLIGLLAKLPCTSLVAVKSLFELNVSSTINGNWSLQTSPMACHTCLCKNKMISAGI